MIIRRWLGDTDFDGKAMRIIYDEWHLYFLACPIVKVDGELIKNVSMADDFNGVVEYVKARKLLTIKGNVEIIGERK